MSTPKIVMVLEDILHELTLIRRHLDPPVSPEERSAFLEAVTEQMADHDLANLYKTPKDSKSPSLQAQLLGKPTNKPKKATKEKGKLSDKK